MDNKVYHPDIDELSDDKCTKVPILPSAYAPAYAKWLEQLESSYLAYTSVDAKYCLCQLPVCAICTIVHKSKFIAEKFCSIAVEGSSLCKHHKQLHPSKSIIFLDRKPWNLNHQKAGYMRVLCQFWVFKLWNQFRLEHRAKNVISHRKWVFRNHGSGHLGCVLLALVCSFLACDINDINTTQNREMNLLVLRHDQTNSKRPQVISVSFRWYCYSLFSMILLSTAFDGKIEDRQKEEHWCYHLY